MVIIELPIMYDASRMDSDAPYTPATATDVPEEKLERFENATKWYMVALSVAIIPSLAVPYLVELSPEGQLFFRWSDRVIWGLFVAEYIVRLWLANAKWRFVKNNKIDLLLVVVPFLRFLRPLGLLRFARLGRLLAPLLLVARGIKAARPALIRHGVAYALLIAGLATVGGMILVYTWESQRAESEITSWRSAAWWTLETLTTAGSETQWPESREGQVVRIVLVLAGLALFGLITARFASWFVEYDEERREERRHRELQTKLAALEAKLDRILREADASTSAVVRGEGGDADSGPGGLSQTTGDGPQQAPRAAQPSQEGG